MIQQAETQIYIAPPEVKKSETDLSHKVMVIKQRGMNLLNFRQGVHVPDM